MAALSLQFRTVPQIQRILADRVRQLRLDQNLKQSTLARRAGVTLASLRRFEQKGEASLGLLLRIAQALGRLDDFDGILHPPPARTMAELEERSTRAGRRRGAQ